MNLEKWRASEVLKKVNVGNKYQLSSDPLKTDKTKFRSQFCEGEILI